MATPICATCHKFVREDERVVFALGTPHHARCFWPNSPHLWEKPKKAIPQPAKEQTA